MKVTLLPRNKKLERSKNRLKIFKRLKKIEKKALELNDVLKKATANMNLKPTRKYGVPPEHVEKESSKIEEYRLTYDFSRLKKSIKMQKDTPNMIEDQIRRPKKLTFTASRGRISLSLV